MKRARPQQPTPDFCQGLIYSVLQNPNFTSGRAGFTVALVSAHSGAGTTFLTSAMSDVLNEDSARCATVIDCREIVKLNVHSKVYIDSLSGGREVMQWQIDVPRFAGSWKGSVDFRAKYLGQLRERFPYLLIDCPSLKESSDALSVAPLVDGFILVVEANRTQKLQVANLERSIEAAGGKILGHLLNKRTYPIPAWIHNKMESWGI